jgi:hypothetical protein
MQIRVINERPCEAATALRSHVYNDRNLWLLEDDDPGHQIRVQLEPTVGDAVRVRCSRPVMLGEVVAQLANVGADVIVLAGPLERTSDGVHVDVPAAADNAVAIALFRALCVLARPATQPGTPPRRRWFSRLKG